MAFGLGNSYFSLKTTEKCYPLLKKAINVAYIPKDYLSYGFVGTDMKKKLKETVCFAVDKKGEGLVIP